MRTRPGCRPPLPHASCTVWEPAPLSLQGRWAGGRPADPGEQQRSRSKAPLGPGPPALPEREIRGGEALSALCLPVTNGTDNSSGLAAPPWLPPPHHGKAVGFVRVRTPPRPLLLSTATRAATCVRRASPQAPPFAAASPPPRGLAPQQKVVWGAPECVQAQEAGAQGRGRAGTFLPGGVVRVEIPGHRDHLEHEVVPSLADHVHHLPVADLDNVLVVHLQEDRGCGCGAAWAEGNSTHPWAALALSPDGRTVSRLTA